MAEKKYLNSGIEADWYQPRELSDSQREEFRNRSSQSQLAALAAKRGEGPKSIHPIYNPRLDPSVLMPRQARLGITSLSMFSGGGGLDLGFDLAGFEHVSSYELLDFAAQTISNNRPSWSVNGGSAGDVTEVEWDEFRGQVDVIHGGPPCQPFSTAGRQKGKDDSRDMFPQFVRAVKAIRPRAFVAENVKGLSASKFRQYINETILEPLSPDYEIRQFLLNAASYGVPQGRIRLVFIGFHKKHVGKVPMSPEPTHDWTNLSPKKAKNRSQGSLLPPLELPKTMGVREALGLPDIGFDALCPTLRCSLTGPRGTTSILSSTAAQKVWSELTVWPNGVSATREMAQNYPAKNDHYRLSVEEVALLQGFPDDWEFSGAVHKCLGQIGNSVAPPKAYQIAKSIAAQIL